MQLDKMVIVVGPPKTGKTTYVRGLVVEHLTTYPTGLALVHDTNGDQFTDICAKYETVAAYRAKVLECAQAGKPLPRGSAFLGLDSRGLTALAVELGEKHNAADSVRVPIMLVFDETSMMETSGSTWIDKTDLQMVATRRHKGIVPVFNLQREGALTQAFYDMATDVIIFSQNDQDAAKALTKKCGGLAKGSIDRMIGAPKFVYAHWRQGEGLV